MHGFCWTVVSGIVMGKHSGRNALNTRLQQLGFDLTPQEVDDVFRRFKVGMVEALAHNTACVGCCQIAWHFDTGCLWQSVL